MRITPTPSAIVTERSWDGWEGIPNFLSLTYLTFDIADEVQEIQQNICFFF